MQLLLLSLSPWPRPRLSSCISRRSKITSSWPGEVKCESLACHPVPRQTVAFGRTQITGPTGKAQEKKQLWKLGLKGGLVQGWLPRGRNRRLGESRLTLTGYCPYSVTREGDQARRPGREPHLDENKRNSAVSSCCRGPSRAGRLRLGSFCCNQGTLSCPCSGWRQTSALHPPRLSQGGLQRGQPDGLRQRLKGGVTRGCPGEKRRQTITLALFSKYAQGPGSLQS